MLHSETGHRWPWTRPRGAQALATIAVFCAAWLAGAADRVALAGEEPAALTAQSATALVRDVRSEVEELRGLAFKRPVPVEVIDDDRAREHLIRRWESFQSREDLMAVQRAYKLLGLLPPDADILQSFLDALREQAGGFYDPPSGSFYLLDDLPAILGPTVAVHELTHALEDQHFDLDARLRGALRNDDRLFALGSVHEGSASLLMTVSLTRQVLRGDLDPVALQAYTQSEAARVEELAAMPPVLLRQLVGPYVLGASFLLEGDFLAVMAAGYPREKVDRAYAAGPASSEQILHPEKYWSEAGRDDPRPVRLDRSGRKLGRRWHRAFEGTLGEITLGILVDAPTPLDVQSLSIYEGRSWTNAAAEGWDGDRWELWTRGEEAVVILGTLWDSPADAEEFAAALPRREQLRWRVSGDRVAIAAGPVPRKAEEALLERILAAVEQRAGS